MAYTNVKFGITNPNFGSNEYQGYGGASFTVGGNTNGTFGIQPIPEQPVQNINGFNNVSTSQFGSAYSNSNQNTQNTQNTQTQQVSAGGIRDLLPKWQWLQGVDTYQALLDQGQDAWGRQTFGLSWDKKDPDEKDFYWTQALHNAENSPNRFKGGLLNSLGSFRDISALGLGVAGLLNEKKMADRQYGLQKEAFDLAKEDYYNREARAKEEFAARRNARSGGQI